MGMPQGEDYNYEMTTKTGLKKKVKRGNKKLAQMLSNLMIKTTREKDNHQEYNGITSKTLLNKYCYVVDTADDLMESANKNIDRYNRERIKGEDYEKEYERAFSLKTEHDPSISTNASELIKRTKNYLMKPQLNFEHKMDNSYFQFVPIISRKENALCELHPRIKKLQEDYIDYKKKNENIEYSPDSNIPFVKIPNPYEQEITTFDIKWSDMLAEISGLNPKMPLPVEETSFEYIDKEEQLERFIEELQGYNEIAVDLEYHAYRSYMGFTCLMQLSTRDKDYIVDTLALRSKLHCLNKIFTDPKVVKILHGAKSDIVWLQKDFGVYIVNLFDTGEASRALGLKKASLAYLLKYYCDVDADKKYQLADWRQRPLPEEMVKYSREDTHYLLYIYDKMRLEMANPKNSDDNPVAYLRSVWKTSKDICLQTYQKPKAKDLNFFGIMSRNATIMGTGQLQILEMLLTWRDFVARVEDESTKFVMPNDVLFDVAKSTPKDLSELEQVLRRHPKHTHHESILKYEEDLLKRINETVAKCEETIKSKVESDKKRINSANHLDSSSSSSSSDSEEETKVVKPKSKVKSADTSKLQINIDSTKYPSKVFHKGDQVQDEYVNPNNVVKLQKFETNDDLGTMMGLNPKYVAKLKKDMAPSHKEAVESLPQNIVVEEVSHQELKDAVLRVEEVKIQHPDMYQDDNKSEKSNKSEDKIELPPSMSDKYHITKKGKRSNKGISKRQKTGEQVEQLTVVPIQPNEPTTMEKISEITKQVTKDTTVEDKVAETKANKRAKKIMIKSNLESGVEHNPELWDQALEKCDKVVDRELNKSNRGGRKDGKKGGKKGGQKGGSKKNSKSKSASGSGSSSAKQKTNKNRFAFIDNSG